MDGHDAAPSNPSRVWVPIAIVVVVIAAFAWFLPLRDPGPRTDFRLRVHVDLAREVEMIPSDTNVEELVTNTARVLVDRLERIDCSDVSFTINGDEIDLTAHGVDDPNLAIDVLLGTGDIRFLIEVLPDERYMTPAQRQRTGVWHGTADEFDAFKTAELDRWRAARERSALVDYRPQDPRYRLVRRRGTPGVRVDDFVVVEQPQRPEWEFDGRILVNPRIARGFNGRAVANFGIRGEHQERLEQFTTANIGLPLAIVVDGETDATPIIQAPLSESIQVSFGGHLSFGEAESAARTLVATLTTGSLPVPVELLSVRTHADDERTQAVLDAEARMLDGIAETLVDLVGGEPWNWSDGGVYVVGVTYGHQLGLVTPDQADILDSYRFEVGLSRPVLGDFDDADAAEAEAPPIRVSIVVRNATGDALIRREGTVTEAEARAVDGEALLEAFRARHASLSDAFEMALGR